MSIFLSFVGLLCLFSSCLRQNITPQHFRGIAMTVPYDIQIADPLSGKEIDLVENCLSKIFEEINSSLNHWNEDSEVNHLNSFPLKVSHHLYSVLSLSKKIYELSHKRFDPTCHILIKHWKTALDLGAIPDISTQDISSFMEDLTLQDQTIFFPNKSLRLDFDGITKGYTVDLIVEKLEKMGFKNIFVNWGGEIKAKGQYSPNRPWKALLPHPDHQDQSSILDIKDRSLATSGDYEQLWEVSNHLYTHIIDPLTYQAKKVTSSSVASVCVSHASCAIADALATAAMTIDDKKALFEWISHIKSKLQDVEFWVFFHEPTD